jgi:hypothetical protein
MFIVQNTDLYEYNSGLAEWSTGPANIRLGYTFLSECNTLAYYAKTRQDRQKASLLTQRYCFIQAFSVSPCCSFDKFSLDGATTFGRMTFGRMTIGRTPLSEAFHRKKHSRKINKRSYTIVISVILMSVILMIVILCFVIQQSAISI